MQIYKIIADKKPEWCALCPLTWQALGWPEENLCGRYDEKTNATAQVE